MESNVRSDNLSCIIELLELLEFYYFEFRETSYCINLLVLALLFECD